MQFLQKRLLAKINALRDQIIEDLLDGDTINPRPYRLQTKDLMRNQLQTITKCQGLEAARKSHAEIQHASDAYSVQAIYIPRKCVH
jgi:hypothetical protein